MKRATESSVGMELSPGVRRTLIRFVVAPSWVLMSALVLLLLAGLEVSGWVQYVPFALSLVFLGLPHGAVDHLVPGRLSAGGVSAGSITAVTLLYLVLAGIYLTFWYFAPVAAFVFFIALTWFHWGQGDLYSNIAFLRIRPSTRTSKALTVLVRGGLPMLVPLLAFPEVYSDVAETIVGLFSVPGELAWLSDPAIRSIAGVIFSVSILATFAWGYAISRQYSASAWGLDVAETVLLLTFFALAPPVFAVGIYFCLWHAPRHIARLMLVNHSSLVTLEKGMFRPALKDFVCDAFPLTAAALLLLAGLYLFVPANVEGNAELLALYLVLISVLTLPHVAIVGLMDRWQGLWRAGVEGSKISR
ncbi:Brp/Blh family beta-carotene 15,15'-dioxygenase [soil metagenome]